MPSLLKELSVCFSTNKYYLFIIFGSIFHQRVPLLPISSSPQRNEYKSSLISYFPVYFIPLSLIIFPFGCSFRSFALFFRTLYVWITYALAPAPFVRTFFKNPFSHRTQRISSESVRNIFIIAPCNIY